MTVWDTRDCMGGRSAPSEQHMPGQIGFGSYKLLMFGFSPSAPVAKPELKQIVKGNKMVVLGDTLTLTCRSPSGTPPIVYTLSREGEQIGRKEIPDNSEAVFMVNTTKLHDLGQYQCGAYNRNAKSNAVSDALIVTVISKSFYVNEIY